MTSVRGIVFDLDGTLIDSIGDIAAAGNTVLARQGRAPHSVQAYRGFIGNGIVNLVRRAWGLADDAAGVELDAMVAEVRREYTAHCLDSTRPFPGIDELLATLRSQGIPLAVLSNKPDPMTQRMVAELFEDGTFVFVAGERSGIPRKPDPTGALQAAAALGVPADTCAMVGDLRVDIETGRAAGMRAIAVTWGMGHRDDLVAMQPDALLEHPSQLLTRSQ